MIRIQITVPHADNDGTPVPFVHEWTRRTLNATYGGHTSVDASGEWLDNGRTYTDASRVYSAETDAHIVKLEGIRLSPRDAAERIARVVRCLASQECVKVTSWEVDTTYV